ncbi:hypothetical protein [Bacteroides hominis]|uniref:hypothetical protein n=1 Tax=Bacteroides hominis TaxID=2763023 RepID=UPI0029498FAA|nr:hypothetical protein [Bacteroides hominis (ex Liu et al. 2022)]MDV6184879.1 hypothetical protein [Bacteroides hominis (ex Liu et al. 2022)]
MKKKSYVIPIMVLFTGIIHSCKDDEITISCSNESAISTRSGTMDILVDEHKSKMQSDPENMLIDQIVYCDSMYMLNLSRTEAVDLNIPDSLYEHYSKIVFDLNHEAHEKK